MSKLFSSVDVKWVFLLAMVVTGAVTACGGSGGGNGGPDAADTSWTVDTQADLGVAEDTSDTRDTGGIDTSDTSASGPCLRKDASTGRSCADPDEVVLGLPDPELLIGSYRDIEVQIGSNVTCDFEDLTFEVGGKWNQISRSRGENFDPSHPTVRLLAGGTAGSYTLQAYCQGTLKGTTKFAVATEKASKENGPPLWLGNKTTSPTEVQSGSLVEQPHDSDRIDEAKSTHRTLVIMYEFSDEEAQWDSDQDFSDRRDYWKEQLSTGHATDNPYEGTFSVQRYWKDVSEGQTKIEYDIPDFHVQLPVKAWVFFKDSGNIPRIGQENQEWGPTGALENFSQVVNKFNEKDKNNGKPNYDVTEYDSLLFVHRGADAPTRPPRTDVKVDAEDDPETMCNGIDDDWDDLVDENDPDMPEFGCSIPDDGELARPDYCGNGWVSANSGEQCDDGNNNPYDGCKNSCRVDNNGIWRGTRPGRRTTQVQNKEDESANIEVTWSPDRWEETRNEEPHQTIAHEYGHLLGLNGRLPDLYQGGGYIRALKHQDVMAKAKRLPYTNVKFRMELGWVPDEEVFTMDPRAMPDGGKEKFKLRPAETNAASSSERYLAGQIYLSRDHYFYVEYRLGQNGESADQMSPFEQEQNSDLGHVMVSEYKEDSDRGGRKVGPESDLRKVRRVLPDEQDTDGPGLGLLEEGDGFSFDLTNEDPSPQLDLKVEKIRQTSSGRHEAVVTVTIDDLGSDPAIRNWSRAASGWKSPDIEIRNPRNRKSDNPIFDNKPEPGKENTIVAKIRNGGEVAAQDVTAVFDMKDFSAGEGEFDTSLGKNTFSIQPRTNQKRKEITVKWGDDDENKPPKSGHKCLRVRLFAPVGEDADATNNIAKSNYAGDWSGSASPAERRGQAVQVRNTHDERVRYHLTLDQTHGDFRAYLEHRWVTLDAGETEVVEVQYEYSEDFAAKYAEQPEYRPQNVVSVQSHHLPPDETVEDPKGQTIDFGAQIRVFAGFKTKMEIATPNAEDRRIEGDVWRPHDMEGVSTGKAYVRVHRANGEIDTYAEDVSGGDIAVGVDMTNWRKLDVQYLGMYPNNPTEMRTFIRQ